MRNQTKVLLIILASVIGIAVVLILSINVFSRQIGDFYISRNNYNDAINWYERDYNFNHSEDSLVNLCNTLIKVDNQFDSKIRYYALLLEKKPSQMTDMIYGNFYLDYLFALYQSDRIPEFEKEFEKRYKLLIDSSDYLGILSPFTLIYDDDEASTDILTWSIGMIEKVIEDYDYNDIKRFGYKLESVFYTRLGDSDKAIEYDDKSNQYK